MASGPITMYTDDRINACDLSQQDTANALSIDFDESKFEVSVGDTFDYYSSVRSTNGTMDPINDKAAYLKPVTYVVQYTVRDNDNAELSRTYQKLLIVHP